MATSATQVCPPAVEPCPFAGVIPSGHGSDAMTGAAGRRTSGSRSTATVRHRRKTAVSLPSGGCYPAVWLELPLAGSHGLYVALGSNRHGP